jgi:hypothetical protein
MRMTDACVRTRLMTFDVKIKASRWRGGRSMTAGSTGSTPKDWAGGPSIRILIQRICIAFNGLGNPRVVDNATSDNAATDVES